MMPFKDGCKVTHAAQRLSHGLARRGTKGPRSREGNQADPGSLIAFFFAVATGVSGSEGEAICLAVNLVLGVAGASCGMLAGKSLQGTAFRWADLVLPLVLGLVAGAVGYFWLDCAISRADPPL
jgi:hypothetical protein